MIGASGTLPGHSPHQDPTWVPTPDSCSFSVLPQSSALTTQERVEREWRLALRYWLPAPLPSSVLAVALSPSVGVVQQLVGRQLETCRCCYKTDPCSRHPPKHHSYTCPPAQSNTARCHDARCTGLALQPLPVQAHASLHSCSHCSARWQHRHVTLWTQLEGRWEISGIKEQGSSHFCKCSGGPSRTRERQGSGMQK